MSWNDTVPTLLYLLKGYELKRHSANTTILAERLWVETTQCQHYYTCWTVMSWNDTVPTLLYLLKGYELKWHSANTTILAERLWVGMTQCQHYYTCWKAMSWNDTVPTLLYLLKGYELKRHSANTTILVERLWVETTQCQHYYTCWNFMSWNDTVPTLLYLLKGYELKRHSANTTILVERLWVETTQCQHYYTCWKAMSWNDTVPTLLYLLKGYELKRHSANTTILAERLWVETTQCQHYYTCWTVMSWNDTVPTLLYLLKGYELKRHSANTTILAERLWVARVFNLSLKEGVVPFEWKEANIIPLFKKGSRNKSENYRPVSLTSVICKLLERLIKDHMVEFLVKHKLLNSSQHGFLKTRSCLTNMLCFWEEITKWIDVGSPVDIIYLDFQKAFDKVPHQRLLLKLKAHGIGDSISDWIEQWLTDRRQRVVVDGEVSNWKSVLSGVPQGSVLGPILFLIYINDLDDSITSNVLKFADDTKLFRKVNTDGDKQHLQNDLDRLVKWSEKWQMLFNFGKCKCLHTGHRNLNVNYKMGDTVLGTTVKEKDLGVTISADMKVSEQCGIAASKGNQILGLIRRNITYKGKKLIIPLYKAIVRPHLEYCIQAWRPYRKKDIDTLERIQRRATKMIPELRDLSYEERLKECGLTTLETRRLRGDQIEVFKILNGYENIDRNMFFSLKKDSRTRGHEVKLVKDQCRLDIRKHSFSQRTINEWNKLSTDCVTASSVNMFKNKVDTYLRRAGYK